MEFLCKSLQKEHHKPRVGNWKGLKEEKASLSCEIKGSKSNKKLNKEISF